MRKMMALCFALSMTICSMAQNVGIGTNTPDASAQLDVTSTTGGLLIPRMTKAQRDGIATPATGLLIYQTDNTSGFYYYAGSAWKLISSGGKAWLLSGNGGTDPANNFIGTTDDLPLNFRVNNSRAGYLSSNGNSFWGIGSGINTISFSNVGIGNNALFSNSDGCNLVAVGDSALYNNTGSTGNTAVGSKVLFANTSGYYNTANGYQALYANTTGSYNTGIGAATLRVNTTGNYNTANGFNALFNNTNGNSNTSIGYASLFFNTTGSNNAANGIYALYKNTTGSFNTANGSTSLYSNTTGTLNTANGESALFYNAIGSYNSANGESALFYNTSGNYNTASGYYALYHNTTGSENAALGVEALLSNTTGNNNTAIGTDADVTTGNLTNATAIGYNAKVNASNKVRIGNTAVTVIEGQVAYSFPSDARFKYNIKENVPGLDFITKLKPVTYYFDTKKLDTYTKTGVIDNSIIHPVNYTGDEELHTGFLAQDVEKIAEELGYQFDGIHKPANDRDHYSLAYSQFIMPLVKAVQQQQEMISQQKNTNEDQQKIIEMLVDKIANNDKTAALVVQQQKLIEALQIQIQELKDKMK